MFRGATPFTEVQFWSKTLSAALSLHVNNETIWIPFATKLEIRFQPRPSFHSPMSSACWCKRRFLRSNKTWHKKLLVLSHPNLTNKFNKGLSLIVPLSIIDSTEFLKFLWRPFPAEMSIELSSWRRFKVSWSYFGHFRWWLCLDTFASRTRHKKIIMIRMRNDIHSSYSCAITMFLILRCLEGFNRNNYDIPKSSTNTMHFGFYRYYE